MKNRYIDQFVEGLDETQKRIVKAYVALPYGDKSFTRELAALHSKEGQSLTRLVADIDDLATENAVPYDAVHKALQERLL